MPYQYDAGPGQTIFLDNPGDKTLITLSSGGVGQQQQVSTQVPTGSWIEVPQAAQVGGGVWIRCITAQGIFIWQVQGTQIKTAAGTQWPAAQAVPMMPLTQGSSLPPLQPMKMGDMDMSANPMTMKMGNMTLSMGQGKSPSLAKAFCTQCGAAVGPGDRFCGSCGHQLQ